MTPADRASFSLITLADAVPIQISRSIAVKGKDLCTKKRFNLDLGDLVLANQRKLDNEDDDSAVEFSGQDVQNLLDMLATWGTGKYTLDLDVYHREVKPIFIKEFKAAFIDFTSKCGTNPDFEIDRKDIVNPNAVKGQDLCTKKRFSLDLWDVVLAYQLIPDNEDGDSEVDFLHHVLATWGTGRYTLGLDAYHRQVKPIFITRFRAAFNDFISKCGNNPDFEIDRNGIVNPNAIRGRDLYTRASLFLGVQDGLLFERSQVQRRFNLDLGDVALAHQTPWFNSALGRGSAYILTALAWIYLTRRILGVIF